MSLGEMVLNIQKCLKENYHPHVEISIDSTSYQIKVNLFNSGNLIGGDNQEENWGV